MMPSGVTAGWRIVFLLWVLSSLVLSQPFESAYFYPDTLEQHIGWASLCRHQDSRDQERPVITTFLGLSLLQAGLCLKSRTLWGAVTL